jgi:Succinate dehydrogenase/fumarate reductase, flavoprotein subunit
VRDQVDFETDVLVVGYGGAGAVAAIAAYDSGVEVTILEKMNQGGGATRLSSGGIYIPLDMGFADYLDDIWIGRTSRDVIDAYVENAMHIEDYLKSIGCQTERWKSQEIGASYPPLGRPSWSKVGGGKSMVRCHATASDEKPVDPAVWEQMTYPEKVWHIGRTYGIHLWEQLSSKVAERDIPIHYNTRVNELIQNGAGEVTGVKAESQGKQMIYKARRAVIMTTGGFGANEQMKAAYLSCPFVYGGTNDFATGDGHIMSQKAGARFWHMQAVCGQVGFKAPEFDQAFQPRCAGESFVWVDKHGRRYTNETSEKLHNAWRNCSLFDPENNLRDGMEWPRIPVYMVFDEVLMKAAPISRDWRPNKDHDWSLDNSDELARGWIKKGDTIAELARELSMDESILELTISNFNENCRTGADPEFRRAPETMAPVNHGPYYALPLMPMLISTQGGPEHDKESRVLDHNGNPIPRLYAAGELSSIIGWLYEAGGGHAECIVFGKIAGENAAKETLFVD